MEHLPCQSPLTGDPDLLARAARGDASAFEAFVLRHREAVWRLVRSLTRDLAAAEDALQETFLSAWRNAATFRGDSSALGWLWSIARNAVYRQHRTRVGAPERMESLAELGEAAGWGAETDILDALLVKDEVNRALACLSLEERELLMLREVEGLSNEECASLLGVGLPALKSRLHRARLRFVAHLRGGHRGH
jgi:RNA polymerase sigma-70 factor (ECF subfamily)